MSISIELNQNRLVQHVTSEDKEIVGVVIPSNSGYEFPQIVKSYQELTDIFSDSRGTDLSRYRLLFQSNYYLAPVKVTTIPNNYCTLRVTDSEKLRIYYPQYVPEESYSLPSSQILDSELEHVSKMGDNYTNHQVWDLTGVDKPQHKDFLVVPGWDDNLKSWQRKLFWFSTNTLDSSIDLNISDYSLGRVIINAKSSNWKDQLSLELRNMGYMTRWIGSKLLMYTKDRFFPIVNYARLNGSESKREVSFKWYNITADLLVGNREYCTFRSTIPGDYGKKIRVEFSTITNRCKVYFKGELKESYEFNSPIDLSDQLQFSKYIRVSYPERSDWSNVELTINSYLGGCRNEPSTMNDVVNTIDVFLHEDVDIDMFLYEGTWNDFSKSKVKNLIDVKKLTSVVNVNDNHLFTDLIEEYKSLLYIYGYFKMGETIVPNSFLFMKLLHSTHAGEVPNNILLSYKSDKYSDLKYNKLSFVETDGLKYYINYYHGTYERRNIVYEITRMRIHRRFYRLKHYLGSDMIELEGKVNSMIADLKRDISLIEYVTLVKCERDKDDESKCTIEVLYKLPEIREETLKLNITLNTWL